MHHEIDLNDDRLFDRLVDGELSSAERRQLLATLDDRPGGWRRCALAFVEAQTWRQELGRLVDEPASPADVSPIGGERPITRDRSVFWLTLAASVFIAFTLGLALRDLPHPHQQPAPNPFNTQVASATPEQAHGPQNPEPEQAAASPDALTLWVRDDTGQTRPLRVPLVDATAMDKQMGLEFQSGLPPAVRAQLEERGYQVQSQRRYAPLLLENGRPLVVPVEDTRIVPVSNRVY